jgi:hypothetical protein
LLRNRPFFLDPEIPNEIAEASRAFAIEVRAKGGTLQDNWLNNGPTSLARSPSAAMGGAPPNRFCRYGHLSPLPWPKGSALRKAIRTL